MASVDLHAARIPDRDRMVAMLREHGLEPEPHGELEIRIPCEDGDSAACDDLFTHVESIVLDLGATMIPVKHDGVIYLRPPVG